MIESKLRQLGDSLIWAFVNAVATDVTCSTRVHEVVHLWFHRMLRDSSSISLLRKKDTALEAILHIRLRHHELRLHHLCLIRIRIHEHLGRRRVWIHVHRRLLVHLLWGLLKVIVWRALVRGTRYWSLEGVLEGLLLRVKRLDSLHLILTLTYLLLHDDIHEFLLFHLELSDLLHLRMAISTFLIVRTWSWVRVSLVYSKFFLELFLLVSLKVDVSIRTWGTSVWKVTCFFRWETSSMRRLNSLETSVFKDQKTGFRRRFSLHLKVTVVQEHLMTHSWF